VSQLSRKLLLAGILAAATALLVQPVAAAAPASSALVQLRAGSAFDGVYTTSTGETVRISVSDQLTPDEAENQRWAEFLASLPHGWELAYVLVYLAPPVEVRALCRSNALACYSGNRIVFPSEELPGQPSRESILAHEYGHHVANNRPNPPWPGVLYGTKRWATYAGICSGLQTGRFSFSAYEVNPAEVFAESYRVLVERRLALQPTPWRIIASSLQPDDTALSLLEQDVLDPWQRNTVVQLRGSRTRSFRVATPLDGSLTLTLRAPRTSVYELRVPGSPAVRARGRGPARVVGTVCGNRQASATVRRISGRGTFQLVVSRP
jgi:hypothetical protein